MNNLSNYWYKDKATWLLLLLPLEYLFRKLAKLNKTSQLKQQYRPRCPLIIVGNISVGGTGKSPLSIALIVMFQKQGYNVGVVSRGYGSKRTDFPYQVKATDSPDVSADEPLMIVQTTGVNLVVDPNRANACRYLLEQHQCDLIISDDGLQHYKMARDIEIAVIDGTRGLGNGHCMPVGPLREPEERLNSVDFIVVNGLNQKNINHCYSSMTIQAQGWYRVSDNQYVSLEDFKQQCSNTNIQIHGVAGIGNPKRFYQTLQDIGIKVIQHSFDDHHQFQSSDFSFVGSLSSDIICMTQKDAVKCQKIAPKNSYYLKVSAKLEDCFLQDLTKRVEVLIEGSRDSTII